MWIAEDNPAAADALLAAAMAAARRLQATPKLGRVRVELAPERYRFWSLRGFPFSSGLRRGGRAADHPPFCASVPRSAGCARPLAFRFQAPAQRAAAPRHFCRPRGRQLFAAADGARGPSFRSSGGAGADAPCPPVGSVVFDLRPSTVARSQYLR
jgi:hypothetical protein